MKNISKDLYNKLSIVKTNLGKNKVDFRDGKKAVDMSLENTDFRKVSTDNKFLMNLLEDDTRKKKLKECMKKLIKYLIWLN